MTMGKTWLFVLCVVAMGLALHSGPYLSNTGPVTLWAIDGAEFLSLTTCLSAAEHTRARGGMCQ
jgi:hypothetical protein